MLKKYLLCRFIAVELMMCRNKKLFEAIASKKRMYHKHAS